MNTRSVSFTSQFVVWLLLLSLMSCTAPVETSPIAAADWISYAHPSGVSLQYPDNWEFSSTETGDSYPLVVFVDPSGPVAGSPHISLEVYDRAPEYRDATDPYTWQPNEGGYEVQWGKTITIAEAEGFEFVWARRIDSVPEDGTLMAITYSEAHQLDIRLSMSLPDTTLQEGETEGWESVISDFGFFEAMVKSILIDR